MMKLKNINSIFFILIIMFFFIGNIFVDNEEKIIKDENRLSASFPKLSIAGIYSGEFFRDFEKYYGDHFIGRDSFISLSTVINSYKGVQSSNKVELMEYEGVNTVKDTDWGRILILNNGAMEINSFNETAATNYGKSINEYSLRFPSVNIYSMLIPTKIDFIEEEKYKDLSVSQKETIALTQDFFNDNIINVNVWNNLYDHKDEYLYFRTDHHWTQRGAFYAYQELAKLMGEEIPKIDNYTISKHEDFLGSLYLLTKSEELLKEPDYIEVFNYDLPHKYYGIGDKVVNNEGSVYVKEWLDTEEKYAVFMGGDYPLLKIETENNLGRNILVLKDSYANAFIPFLTGVGDNIVVVDPRLFKDDVESVIKEHNITDIIFVNYALITRNDGYGELYLNLLKGYEENK